MGRARYIGLASLLATGLALAALSASADTIVLKNGKRILAANVVEENGRVSYETSAGRLSLPKAIVERIERGGPSYVDSAPGRAMDLAIAPPPVESSPAYDDVARASVRGGAIDREYIAKLEVEARGGDATPRARASAAHQAAADFELNRGDTDHALDHYRRALTYTPEHVTLLLNIAYLHLRRDEYTPALDYLGRARRVAPDSADVAKLAGWAYYGMNKIDQAVAEWRRAQRIRPDADVAHALDKAKRDQEVESSFREGETQHFALRYSGASAQALARDVLRTLEGHFREIESELRFTPREPIGVILYTEQAFADITRAPGWVGALNDGRIRVPVQGLTSVPPEFSRVLKHELTHSFITQKTRGRCPVWLQEGVAQWVEGLSSGESASVLVAAYEHKASVPLSALEGSWLRMPPELASYAYAWSLSVVEYIISRYGMSDLVRILDWIASEPSTEAAVRRALRMDYPELEQETSKYLRKTYLR